MLDQAALDRLLSQEQYFFLPYYRDVVADHPYGIRAADVKALVQRRVIEEFGFDPFDSAVVDANPSTGASAASQWANNLVSNKVLDAYMAVVRNGRATLYPWSADGVASPTTLVSAPPQIDDALVGAANSRTPQAFPVTTTTYARLPALAEYVRQKADYQCLIGSAECHPFPARNGKPYTEVHHILPMSDQGKTSYNLDRSSNMVALCVRCHTILHHGSRAQSKQFLTVLLDRYAIANDQTFDAAMINCPLSVAIDDLLDRY
jgi:hypothetical protein